MARNTIQKKFTTTEVRGYVIEDGQPKAVSFELDKQCGLNSAQAIIRREHPSFSAAEVIEHATLYKMDFETFKKYATPCDETEAEEAE